MCLVININYNLLLEILLTIIYTLIFIVLIFRMKFFEVAILSKPIISLIFIIKILAGIFLYLIYTYYYNDRTTADIFKYFDDSKIMFDALLSRPVDYFKMILSVGNDNSYFEDTYYKVMNNWYRVYESNVYNDSHTIIRFNAVVRIFSFGYYNVHTVFMSFLSLSGLVALFKFLVPYFQQKKIGLIVAVFCMPSVLLWSSGVLKEGLLVFGLGMLLYSLDRIFSGKYVLVHLFWILVSLVLLFYTKFYILICLIPLLISYYWIRFTRERYIEIKYISILLIYFLIGFNIHYVFPQFNVLEIIVLKQHDFINLAKAVDSGSIVNIGYLEPTISNLIMNTPKALYNCLFLPWFFESCSPLVILAGIENLFIIIFAITVIIFFTRRTIHRNLFYFALLFVFFTYTLVGLITPVIGAIVRYKVPALPFLMVILLFCIDPIKTATKTRSLLIFKKP